jgi:hypothetical protein
MLCDVRIHEFTNLRGLRPAPRSRRVRVPQSLSAPTEQLTGYVSCFADFSASEFWGVLVSLVRKSYFYIVELD